MGFIPKRLRRIDKKQPAEETARLYSDAPITDPDDDLLGWKRLAERVSWAIRRNLDEKAFVIGVQGRWGYGKTSLLNLLESELQGSKRFRILRYNPWLYPDGSHFEHFFEELAKVAGFGTLRRRLRSLARWTKPVTFLATALKTLWSWLLTLLGGTAFLTYKLLAMPDVVLWISVSMGALGILIGIVSGILGSSQTHGARQDNTLSQFKAKIDEHLRKKSDDGNLRFVVLIDDLDRLQIDEICDVFQIVKNNADLHGLTFVIAYDRAIVEEALEQRHGSAAYRAFTQKIVQIEFTLPRPDASIVGLNFLEGIDEIVKSAPSSVIEYWSKERWSSLFHQHTQYLFETFRETKRALNGILLNLDLLLNQEMIEVNPVDFVLLEMIRTQFPAVYEFIRRNRLFVVQCSGPSALLESLHSDSSDELSKELNATLDAIVDQEKRRHLEEVLKELFPKLAPRFAGAPRDQEANDSELARWKAELRICSEHVFSSYILLGNYAGDVPNAEVRILLDKILREDAPLDAARAQFFQPTALLLLKRTLATARHLLQQGSYERMLLRFIFDISDKLPAGGSGFLSPSTAHELLFMIKDLLTGLSEHDRFQLLQTAINETQAVFGPVAVVHLLDRVLEERAHEESLLQKPQVDLLKKALVYRAKAWLSSDDSLNHPHFRQLLEIFRLWLPAGDIAVGIGVLLKEDINFKKFLPSFVRVKDVSSSDKGSYQEREFDFKGLYQYTPPREAYERAMRLSPAPGDEGDYAEAHRLFTNGYHHYVPESQ